ncbi:MAG: site-specific DNA-methyltransferase [Clostridia bacterium]
MCEFNWEGKELAYKLAETPSMCTLIPDKESSKNWDDTENLYIEGDNLEVLKLLQKSYFGKVKMIYIDPPYNTGNDFMYHDNFKDNIDNYKKITNQTTKANPETNSRYHTDWLNMMYPRLKLARNLLSEDGTIFISIDDTEVENLRKVCDEVFGEENFVTEFIWEKKKKPSFLHKNVGKLGEYILCYVKDEHNTFPFSVEVTTENKKYPINNAGNSKSILKFKSGSVKFGIEDSTIKAQDMSEGNIITKLINDVIIKNGVNENDILLEGEWRYSQDKLDSIINKGEELYISKIPFRPNHIKKGGEIKKMKNFLSPIHYNCETNEDATYQIIDLLECNVFDYSKPIKLMKLLIKAISYNDAECIILDFFSGSSTTAHAVMQLNTEDNGNRKFIMVQLPELTDEKSEAYKAGYKNICEIGKERIRRAGEKIVSENKDKEGIEDLDIGFKVFKLDYNKGGNKMYNAKLIELSNKTNIMYRGHQIYELKDVYFYVLQTEEEYIQWKYKNDIFWNMEHSEEFYNRLMNPMKIEILTNKKPKELKGKKKIATINKDADYKVQVFIDDDYNLYYQDNHAFASCESKIVDNKVETTWNSCKCWFKIIGLYECRNNHIVDILRDLNSYSEYLYPKNNVADNAMLSRLYEQMVNVYLDYVNN